MSKLREILGEGGLLSEAFDAYELRPQQLDMAEAVEKCMKTRTPLIVEAATGTGKTMAYLIPSLLSGKRVVVSTGTKALQEQLFRKDIPLLAKVWPTDFKAVLLKGRKNYLCKLRFDAMRDNPNFRSREDARQWPKLLSWGKRTRTGDRAEVKGLPDDFATWNDLAVGTEACLGTKCEHYEECFVTRARRDASDADIVVVNHHLFFADLAVKEGGHGEILPDADAVIFDEAHQIESVATSYFGLQFSNWRVRELVDDIQRTLDEESIDAEEVEVALKALEKTTGNFFSIITFGLYDGRYELSGVLSKLGEGMVKPAVSELLGAYADLERKLIRVKGLGELAPRLVGRCAEHQFELGRILEATDPRYVYSIEMRDRSAFLQASPIDLAELLREKLLQTHDRLVFTSATLSTGGSFDFFEQRIGVRGVSRKREGQDPIELKDIVVDRLELPPVFNYQEQALVYIPRRLPAPNKPGYIEGVVTVIEYLVGLSKGRAFVLFTSYANLNAAHDALADRLPFKVLKQGEAPRGELLEAFRSDTHSVLFATSSFWEGVDVEGEALSLVILDKLPFANPSDPLTAARLSLLDSTGHDSFREFSMPLAALSLKQGFGRLIRSKSDVGAVAILDSRILNRRYGRYFLDSLPPAPVVQNGFEFRDWWKTHVDRE